MANQVSRRRYRSASCLVTLLLLVAGCASTPPIDRALRPHSPDVTLEVDWRIELVDPGFFPYEPTELGRVITSPTGSTVYIGTSEGNVVAVDSDLGRLLWSNEVGEPVDGAARLDGGELFFGGSDGFLYAIDAGGGGSLWSFESGGNLDSTPAVTDDYVIFSNADSVVICLDRRTGAPLWRAEDDNSVLRVTRGLHPPVKGQASSLVVGDFVYSGFQNGRVAALDLSDGTFEWTTDLAEDQVRHTDVDEVPVLVGDGLLVSSFTGGLYLLDRATGAVRWRQDLRGATRPVVHRGNVLTTTVDGEFISLDPEDGSVQFRLRLDDRAPGPIQLLGDYAIVTTTQGGLYILDAGSPHIFARFAPTDGFASAAVTSRGRIVAFDNRGVLHGLTLRTR